MMIRRAEPKDLQEIKRIYHYAKYFMNATGNKNQWVDGYPSEDLIKEDIENKQSFICIDEGQIHGVFVFTIGIDPTYTIIEQGEWLNSETYGTIHRIASDGVRKGVFQTCLDFCKEQIANVRVDTHEDNKIMQHLLEKNEFKRCGIIYTHNNSPRIAYQWVNVSTC